MKNTNTGIKRALKLSRMNNVAVLVMATAKLSLLLYHTVTNKKIKATIPKPIAI